MSIVKLLEKVNRREDLVREIRLNLLAPKSPKAADELEKRLRAALKPIEEPHGDH